MDSARAHAKEAALEQVEEQMVAELAASTSAAAAAEEDDASSSSADGGAESAAGAAGILDDEGITEATCCVCQDAAPTHHFAPCGHQCVCAPCGELVMTENKQCPLCRAPALCSMRMYPAC